MVSLAFITALLTASAVAVGSSLPQEAHGLNERTDNGLENVVSMPWLSKLFNSNSGQALIIFWILIGHMG